MAALPPRPEDAASRYDAAAASHERTAAFAGAHGDGERAELHLDAAAHERNGAALQRRWASLPQSRDAGEIDDGEWHLSDDHAAEEAEMEIQAEELETRERIMSWREWTADERDRIADDRDRVADARERAADRREGVADEREGTAEARELERVARARQQTQRDRAAAHREQASVDREEAASARDEGYVPQSAIAGARRHRD